MKDKDEKKKKEKLDEPEVRTTEESIESPDPDQRPNKPPVGK